MYQVKKDLAYLTKGSMSIATYFTKFRGLYDEHVNLPIYVIVDVGAAKKLEEHYKIQRITQFLMGLNDKYTTIRGQILMMQPLSCLSQAYALLTQEEKQRECNHLSSVVGPGSAAALFARSGNYKPYFKPQSSVSRGSNGASGGNIVKKQSKKGIYFAFTVRELIIPRTLVFNFMVTLIGSRELEFLRLLLLLL